MATLCEDELFHVFSFLPAKSICKFKCVRKSFFEFTSKTQFSMKHASNMLQEDDTCIIVQPDGWINSYGEHGIHPLPGEELSFGLPRNSLSFLKKMRIIASSNGLILCQGVNEDGQVELCLCNPLTQTWLSVATPTPLLENPHADINVFFKCVDEGTGPDDCLLLYSIENPPEWSSHVHIKVYSPKEGVWKSRENNFVVGGMNMRLNMPLYLGGALHVISQCPSSFTWDSPYFWPYIMSYNFDNKESTMLKIPEDAREGSHDSSCDMRIFEWGKENRLKYSMCLVKYIKDVFTAWILVDYKSNEWRKILETTLEEMGVEEKDDPNVKGFRIVNGDCLIFATRKKVYGYCYIGQGCWRLKEICDHKWDPKVAFTPYSATLRPCGTSASTIPLIEDHTSNQEEAQQLGSTWLKRMTIGRFAKFSVVSFFKKLGLN